MILEFRKLEGGQDIMINFDQVVSITENGDNAYAVFTLSNQDTFKVNETYEEVKKRLGVSNAPKSK